MRSRNTESQTCSIPSPTNKGNSESDPSSFTVHWTSHSVNSIYTGVILASTAKAKDKFYDENNYYQQGPRKRTAV